MSLFNSLPTDILIEIFLHLDVNTLDRHLDTKNNSHISELLHDSNKVQRFLKVSYQKEFMERNVPNGLTIEKYILILKMIKDRCFCFEYGGKENVLNLCLDVESDDLYITLLIACLLENKMYEMVKSILEYPNQTYHHINVEYIFSTTKNKGRMNYYRLHPSLLFTVAKQNELELYVYLISNLLRKINNRDIFMFNQYIARDVITFLDHGNFQVINILDHVYNEYKCYARFIDDWPFKGMVLLQACLLQKSRHLDFVLSTCDYSDYSDFQIGLNHTNMILLFMSIFPEIKKYTHHKFNSLDVDAIMIDITYYRYTIDKMINILSVVMDTERNFTLGDYRFNILNHFLSYSVMYISPTLLDYCINVCDPNSIKRYSSKIITRYILKLINIRKDIYDTYQNDIHQMINKLYQYFILLPNSNQKRGQNKTILETMKNNNHPLYGGFIKKLENA